MRNLLGHTYHVNALSIQNNILSSGGGDTKAIIWDLLLGEKIFTADHDSWIGSVCLTENHLVTSTGKGQINIWEYGRHTKSSVIAAHTGAIRTISLTRDQKYLFSGGKDAKIKMWSFPDLRLIKEFNHHPSEVRRLAIDYSGKTVFSGDSEGNVFKLDLASQTDKHILKLEGQMIRSVVLSGKHNLLAITTSSGEIIVWDIENEIVKWRVQGHNGQSVGVAFHPEKEILVTGGQDKTIKLWHSENSSLLDNIVAHSDTITSLVFSQNGKWLISASRDETISMWQVL